MKYKIGDKISIVCSNKQLEIIDSEIIDGIVLYYTNDGKAYPENMLKKFNTQLTQIISGYYGLIYWESNKTQQEINDYFDQHWTGLK